MAILYSIAITTCCHREERSDAAITSTSTHIFISSFVFLPKTKNYKLKTLILTANDKRIFLQSHPHIPALFIFPLFSSLRDLLKANRGNHILCCPHLCIFHQRPSTNDRQLFCNLIHFYPHSFSFYSFTLPHILSFTNY